MPLQIDDLATVVFHFGGGLGVCLGERVEGALSGVKKVVQSKSPLRWLWGVSWCLLKFTEFLDFGGLVRAPARFFCTLCLGLSWMYLRTALVRMPASQSGSSTGTPPLAQLISRDQRVCAKRFSLDMACSPVAAPLFWHEWQRFYTPYTRESATDCITRPTNSNVPTHKPLRVQTYT